MNDHMDKEQDNHYQNEILKRISLRLDVIEKKEAQYSDSYNLDENAYGALSRNFKNDDIDLKELLQAIWQGKLLIIAITVFFALVSGVYAVKQPDIYRASVLLAPAGDSSGADGLGKLAGQFGGLASIAGINLGGGGSDKTGLALEVLKSRAFLETFIQKYQILVPLMATEKWERSSNKLIINDEVYSEEDQTWIRDAPHLQAPRPSPWESFKEFSKILSVSQSKETGMVTIAIEHYSPHIAKLWLIELIKELNSSIRLSDKRYAQDSIEYLTEQLNQTKVADLQNVFYQLIEEQTKTIMLAEVNDEYVFKIIDPANVPDNKSKPKRAQICVFGSMLGIMLSILIVLIRHFTTKE